MPSELEELVEFLHHGNTQIRQIATENLVPYSTSQPSLFRYNEFEPIKDLKLLLKDYEPIAKNALTIMINLSGEDEDARQRFAGDEPFMESLLKKITDEKEPTTELCTMLLANLAKSSSLPESLLTLSRAPPKPLSTSSIAIDQLLDCFVKGSGGTYNKAATYDYLSYLFADLAKEEKGRRHFLQPRKADADIVPITKLIVFTEHASAIRRRGVANTIKNVCFETSSHTLLLANEGDDVALLPGTDSTSTSTTGTGVGLLPYILLPLMGNEEYADEDTEGMLDECQLLPPDKARDAQNDILITHLETLLLLTTTREGRQRLRDVKVYPIVRELHLQNKDEGVRESCDRLVQVLMRDEEGEGTGDVPRVEEVVNDEDDEIVEIV
nr:protein hgh1 like [Quercus suber]